MTTSLRTGRISGGSIGWRKPSCSITSLTGHVESSSRIRANSSSSVSQWAISLSFPRSRLFAQEWLELLIDVLGHHLLLVVHEEVAAGKAVALKAVPRFHLPGRQL